MIPRSDLVSRLFILLALLTVLPLRTSADKAILLPGVVITASRLPVQTSTTGASTTRLDRDDIERIGPLATADLLRGLPSLHVSHSAGAAYVYLRGGDPNHTVILIDGIPVNDPTDDRGGAFDLGSIDPSEIERLEILRGAGSSAHGSDAMAGVIHIHTRERTARPWLSAEGGGFGHSAIAAGAGTTVGGASLTAGVHERRGGQEIDGHKYQTRGGHLQAAFPDIVGSSLRLTARLTDDDRASSPEASGGTLAILKELETRHGHQLQLGARSARPIGVDTLDAWLAIARLQTDSASPGAVNAANPFASVPASRIDGDFRSTMAGLSLRRSIGGFRLITSAEIEVEDADNAGSIDLGQPQLTSTAFDLRRQSRSLALEAFRQKSGLNLHAAVRLDGGDDFSAKWSPRLGARYQSPSTGTILALSWSQAFKQPSLYAIGNPLVGNANLTSETSWTLDAGVTQSVMTGRLVVELNGFHTRYHELIDFDFESFRLLNRSRVRAEGLELTAVATLPADLTLSSSGSLTSTEVEATRRPLLERPEWIVDTALEWESPHRHQARLRLSVVDDIPSASLATGPHRLDGYVRVDASGSIPLTERVRFRVAVDNLFDTEYDHAVGVRAPGILPRVGLHGEL